MRGGVIAAVVFASVAGSVPPAGATSQEPAPAPPMTVAASPHTARAHRVRLSVTLRYRMQCGYPGAGSLVVTFPSALKLPKQFASGTVKLAGKATPASVKGRSVAGTVPLPKGVLCGTLAPGSVTLLFTRAAQLANPVRAGSYRFTATHGKRTFRAKLAIKPAA